MSKSRYEYGSTSVLNSQDNREELWRFLDFGTAKDKITQGIKTPSQLAGGLLFRRTLAVLGAPEDSFKTNWMVQAAIYFAAGIPGFTFSFKQCYVAYLVLEGGEDYILERIEEKIDALGLSHRRDEVMARIYTVDCSEKRLDDEAVAGEIRDSLLALNPKPEVAIFDPITYALDEDVRYSPDKTKLCRQGLQIAKALNGLVLFVVHTRKDARNNDNMDDFLGSGVIARAAATRIKLYREDNKVSMYAKTRHADRPDKIGLKWSYPLLEVEAVRLKPVEECEVMALQLLKSKPTKEAVLGDLVEGTAKATNHNEKTARSAIANLEVDEEIVIERVSGSAVKLVKLQVP